MSNLNHKILRRDWSELNQELLELIVSKLNSRFQWPEIALFRSVCSSWRDSVQFPKPGPLLLLPSDKGFEDIDDNSVKIELFSARDKMAWDLNWNADIRIVGSSHGWLVLMDESLNPYLYNLFSKIRIELPKKDAIQQLVRSKSSSSEPGFFRTLISKAILTGNPSRTQDYKVVIIHNSCKKLAYWSEGDESWKGFSDFRDYSDVVWSESDETLYAVRDGVIIEGWKFSGDSPTRKVLVECPLDRKYLPAFSSEKCTTQWYLVPSKGDMLFVMRHVGEYVRENGDLLSEWELTDEDQDSCCYKTINFRVFKVDFGGRKFEEVKSLQGEILFLGGNHGVSIPAADCRGFKPDSIYFSDDYWDRMYMDYNFGGHDFGVFSLEDGKVDSIRESDFVDHFEPTPFWVLTN